MKGLAARLLVDGAAIAWQRYKAWQKKRKSQAEKRRAARTASDLQRILNQRDLSLSEQARAARARAKK